MPENQDRKTAHGGGPKTPEGKRRSSLNATRHGLTAEAIVLPNENQAAFQELLDDYVEDFKPATRVEMDLVHELAITRWRQMRVWSMEWTALQVGMKRNEAAAREEFGDELRSNVRTALAFIEMSGDTKAMQLINRYEARLTRRFHQILAELKSLQSERKPVEQASSSECRKTDCETNSTKRAKPAEVIPIAPAKPSPETPKSPADRPALPEKDTTPGKTPSGGHA
jgi:hypothetical protein